MKKLIAILLAVSALTAAAFASAEPKSENAASAGGEKTEISAALTKEDAVAAALKDAGFAEEDVTVTRTRLREKEDEAGGTVAVYTVKFHTEDAAYKYHVNADTGEILDSTVTEGVSEGHGRGENGQASGEADAVTSATEKTGRSGKGRKSASEETDVTDLMTDVTNA